MADEIKALSDSDIKTSYMSSANLKNVLAYIGVYRRDIMNLEEFDASIESGTVSFVRNRTGKPSSNYNYSPGIYFKPTATESLWVMFGRNTNDIVLKVKNTTWETGWHYINSTS